MSLKDQDYTTGIAQQYREAAAPTIKELHESIFGRKRKMAEKDVAKLISDYINSLPGFWIWRRNVGSREWKDKKGNRRFMKFGKKGMCDWEGIGPGGKHLEIEIKRPGQFPSDEQVQWIIDCQSKGSVAFWCDSLEQCRTNLRSFRLI